MIFTSLTRLSGDIFSGHTIEGLSKYPAPDQQIKQAKKALSVEAMQAQQREPEQPSRHISAGSTLGLVQASAAEQQHIA